MASGNAGAAILRIRPTDVMWQEVDGEIIALDLVTSTYFTTNATGTILWHAMVRGATEVQLVEVLEERFGVSEEVATPDVRAFIHLVRTSGLLETQ